MVKCLISKYIFDETQSFRQKLPSFIKDSNLLNKFVVFHEGKIKLVEETPEKAYEEALNLLGDSTPFLINKIH